AVERGDVLRVHARSGVRLVGQGEGFVRTRGGGVGLGLRGVDGDALRGDLVLEVTEDRRIDVAGRAEASFELVEAGRVGGDLVGETRDGGLGRGEAHALGGYVGTDLLDGV